jgi:signal transduction histidine kinase
MDVGAVVRSVVDLLTHQGTLRGMNVSVEVGETLPRVHARTHSLEQVVVNLILNAVDAAPGGTVAVGAAPWRYRVRAVGERRSTDPDGAVLSRPPGKRAWRPELVDGAAGVQLWVADSGPGIPPEDRDAIFDPFYTTKEPGKGTGLGLAIVNRTVHELGGVVWIDDAREGGAAFKVFLPEAGEDDVGHGARGTGHGEPGGADSAHRAPRSEPSDPAPRAPRPEPSQP